MYANHITAVFLALVNHRDKQVDCKTSPAVCNDEPSACLYRATKVEKKRSAIDKKVDFTHSNPIWVFIKFKEIYCH